MDYLNVVIENENFKEEDIELLFGKNCSSCSGCVYCRDEEVKRIKNISIFDLLVELGAFISKGQARKNWKGPSKIPDGWSEFIVGKLKRKLCIWNPKE